LWGKCGKNGLTEKMQIEGSMAKYRLIGNIKCEENLSKDTCIENL